MKIGVKMVFGAAFGFFSSNLASLAGLPACREIDASRRSGSTVAR